MNDSRYAGQDSRQDAFAALMQALETREQRDAAGRQRPAKPESRRVPFGFSAPHDVRTTAQIQLV